MSNTKKFAACIGAAAVLISLVTAVFVIFKLVNAVDRRISAIDECDGEAMFVG